MPARSIVGPRCPQWVQRLLIVAPGSAEPRHSAVIARGFRHPRCDGELYPGTSLCSVSSLGSQGFVRTPGGSVSGKRSSRSGPARGYRL
ncbi:hypothetical protein OH77DRAFT_876444 [Trametes cingulata]|nr:hypothetical protein OH77DRAFT_876444 [Trametes cingulata]